MTVVEVAVRACREPTLVKALSWMAIYETERVVRQAIRWRETGVSTAASGGGWDTCFEACFEAVFAEWERTHRVP